MEWIAGNIPDNGKLYVVATAFGKSKIHHYELDVCYVSENGDLRNGYDDSIYSHGIEDTTFYIPLPPLPDYKSRMDFLTEEQAAKLECEIVKHGKVTADQLVDKLGIDITKATAVIIQLGLSELAECRLLIYHTCSNAEIDSLPFGVGFPSKPYTCPNCGKVMNTLDELRFNMSATIRQ